MKPNFSTLGMIKDISRQEPLLCFLLDDSIQSLSEFDAVTLNEEYNLPHKAVDILSTDKIFLDCDTAHGMIFKVEDMEQLTIQQGTFRPVINI